MYINLLSKEVLFLSNQNYGKYFFHFFKGVNLLLRFLKYLVPVHFICLFCFLLSLQMLANITHAFTSLVIALLNTC